MIGLLIVARIVRRGARSFLADSAARGILTLTLALIVGGALFYRWVEELSWVDSFYLTVVTLTTVGYGDIAPQTTAGKLFTMVYLLVGVGIMVAVVTEVASHLIRANSRQDDGSTGSD